MVVRMRHTRAHTANRRSHHAIKNPGLSTDPKTGSVHLRHRASLDGMYKGKSVIDPLKKVLKKQGKKPTVVAKKKTVKKVAKKK